MTRWLGLVCSAIAASGLLIVAAAPGLAETPSSASGSGTFTFIPNGPPRFADGNVILSATLDGTITGTLSGTWTEQAIEVLHADGSATTHAMGSFNVAKPCGAGSFAFSLEGQQASATSSLTGQFRSVDLSSASVSIHTVDTFTVVSNSGFVYSGTFFC